jgi:hypothetical protein
LQRHHASLCRPQPPARRGTGCSCLEDSSRTTAPLPGIALVRRFSRRKSSANTSPGAAGW